MPLSALTCIQVLEAHPDAHWLLDETGVLLCANRAALRLMGNLTQLPDGATLAEFVVGGDAMSTSLIRQGMRSTAPTPARVRLLTRGGVEVVCKCDIALINPATDDMPAMLWCRLLRHGLAPNQFEVLNQQIDALKREVGRRQAAESEMRQQSECLETVLLGIGDGVIATNVNGTVLFLNQVAAEMTGWPRALAMGRSVTEIARLTTEDEGQTALDAESLGSATAGVGSGRMRQRLIARDGTSFMVESSTSPLINESGNLDGTVLVLHSIEQEVKAEAEHRAFEHRLRESQKMEALGTMAGGVAHDFNNIVAAILGNVELALADTPPASNAMVSMHEIRKAGRRARDLVQQILTFSRRQDNTRAATSVRALLQEAVNMLQTSLPPQARLEIDMQGELPSVWANATQIEQVLLNLIGNALQALLGRDDGRVDISLCGIHGALPPADADEAEVLPAGPNWPGVGLRIQVSDNGIGMAPQTLARIFEPFFTTKVTGSGTGLGLAVVHGVLREHGAVLRVRSTQGVGTRFTVILPAMAQTDLAVSDEVVNMAVTEQTALRATRAPHILYVDDDESMTFLVQRFLERQGYRVTTCGSPDEALAHLSSTQSTYTLCITDFNMPGMSGLALAREIKKHWPNMLVAIASGYISDALREQAPKEGVDELIYKPDTVEELCRSIERLLESDAAGSSEVTST